MDSTIVPNNKMIPLIISIGTRATPLRIPKKLNTSTKWPVE